MRAAWGPSRFPSGSLLAQRYRDGGPACAGLHERSGRCPQQPAHYGVHRWALTPGARWHDGVLGNSATLIYDPTITLASRMMPGWISQKRMNSPCSLNCNVNDWSCDRFPESQIDPAPARAGSVIQRALVDPIPNQAEIGG